MTYSVFEKVNAEHVDPKETPNYNNADRENAEKEKFEDINNYTSISPLAGGGKKLSISIVKQKNSYFCGPALAFMVINYIKGKSPTQSVLASNMGTTKESGTYVYRLAAEVKKQTGKNYIYSLLKDVNFSNTIISNINNDIPLIFHTLTNKLNKNYSFSNGHYVVGSGYEWYAMGSSGYSNVYYIDPWTNNLIHGEHILSISKMQEAINARAGYFIW